MRLASKLKPAFQNTTGTMRSLAKKTKISLGHLSDILNEKAIPSWDCLKTLCPALGLALPSLIADEVAAEFKTTALPDRPFLEDAAALILQIV